jgi:hypothetical protein
VTDWPLPPYFEPQGPLGDDDAVVRAFLRSGPAPHSARLHVEGKVLRVNGDEALALRIGPRTVLVRLDLSDDAVASRTVVEAVAVATMMVALRLSIWDLWGADIDEAFADLRREAMGGEGDALLGGGGPPVGPAF